MGLGPVSGDYLAARCRPVPPSLLEYVCMYGVFVLRRLPCRPAECRRRGSPWDSSYSCNEVFSTRDQPQPYLWARVHVSPGRTRLPAAGQLLSTILSRNIAGL